MHQELVNLVWLTHSVQGLLVAASDRMFIHFTTLPAPTWCKTNKLLKTNFIYECSYHDASICCCVASQASLPIFLFFLPCIDLHKLEINYEREYILK